MLFEARSNISGRVVRTSVEEIPFGENNENQVDNFRVKNVGLWLKETLSIKSHNVRVETVLRQGVQCELVAQLPDSWLTKIFFAAGHHDAGKHNVDPKNYYQGLLSDEQKKRIFGPHSYEGAKQFSDPYVAGMILYHHLIGPSFAPTDYIRSVVTPMQSTLVATGVELVIAADRMVSVLMEDRPYTYESFTTSTAADMVRKEYERYRRNGIPLGGDKVNLWGLAEEVLRLKSI